MAKSSGGFAAAPVEEPVDRSAIPWADLMFDTEELIDSGSKLPVGVFPSSGERLQDFTLFPYSGTQEISIGRLQKNASDRDGNLRDPVKVLREFLPTVIESIGSYSFKELAQKMSLPPQRLLQGMYLADVITIVLKLRLEAQGTDIAMAAKCPACGKLAEDNPKKGRGYHDLSSVNIKYIRHLHQKPVYEITLPEPAQLLGEPITKLWLEPMKLYQLDKLLKGDSPEPSDLEQIFQMVVGMPESSVFANTRGQIFDEALFGEFCRGQNGRVSPNKAALYRAIAELVPGPKMEIDMDCASFQCRNTWKQAIPWISFREFLYFTPDSAE